MPPPGRLKKPPPAAVPFSPGLAGWLNVRLNGCAALGAVEVLGGAEKVREPREPELKPPPTRASAAETAIIRGSASDIATAKALTAARMRGVNLMVFPSIPGKGKAPLRWAAP